MCRFVTATVPAEADFAALEAIAQRHGRRLQPMSNPSIERQIGPGLRYCLTTPGHCDCEEPLGRRRRARVADPAEAAQRLRRKGWSEAKIERALAQRQAARESGAGSKSRPSAPWRAFVVDMLSAAGAARFGLLLHYYHAGLDADIALAGCESLPLSALTIELLEDLREDVLYEFRR